MSAYPWYEIIQANEPLEQGDFFDDCPVLVPTVSVLQPGNIRAEVIEYDIIVLSQSCDLVNDKIEQALVAPVYSLSAWCDFYEKYR